MVSDYLPPYKPAHTVMLLQHNHFYLYNTAQVIQYIFVLGVTVIIAFIQHPLNLFAIYEYGISLGLAVHLAYWIISVKLSGKR